MLYKGLVWEANDLYSSVCADNMKIVSLRALNVNVMCKYLYVVLSLQLFVFTNYCVRAGGDL